MGKGGKGGGGGSAPKVKALGSNITGLENSLQTLSQDYLNYIGSITPDLVTQGVTTMRGSGDVSPQRAESNAILNAQNLAPQYQNDVALANLLAAIATPEIQAGYNQAQTSYGQAQAAYGQTQQDRAAAQAAAEATQGLETGTGLFPSQQAYVNQAVQSGQAAVQQQLASEGLTSSTQNAMLQNEVAQAGAATAGQLMQGNIQLSQAQQGLALQQEGLGQTQQQIFLQQQQVAQEGTKIAQQLSLGEQALSAGATQSLQTLWQTAASEWGGMQAQGFNEALQGYGMIGNFLQGAVSPYGYKLQGYNLMLQQAMANAQLQQNQFLAEQQAQSQGMSSLFSGLGSLFGGGQGGGLFGSIGGLFGAGAGAAGAIGGASAAGGSAIADVAGLAFAAA